MKGLKNLGKWTNKQDDISHLFDPTGKISARLGTLCGKAMTGDNYAKMFPDRKPCTNCMKKLVLEGVKEHVREKAGSLDISDIKMILSATYNIDSDKHNIHEEFEPTDSERMNIAFEWLITLVELFDLDIHFEDHYRQIMIDNGTVAPIY